MRCQEVHGRSHDHLDRGRHVRVFAGLTTAAAVRVPVAQYQAIVPGTGS
jgi:hypothetical protein